MGVAGLAALGFFIAAYLAAYQVGFVRKVWEPCFGEGSVRVLHSSISQLFPVPDAALGAIGYAFELLATVAGGADRWRATPKLVLLYGAIVGALAATGLGLTALQAFVLHDFCTLCLISAAISLLVALLAGGEVLAAFKVLHEKRKT